MTEKKPKIGHRPTREYRTSQKAYFKEFQKLNPDNTTTREQYEQIARMYAEVVGEFLVETGKTHKLPHGLGELQIKKFHKPFSYENKDGENIIIAPIDWIATKKLWEEDKESADKKTLVRYRNSHTNGFIALLEWRNKKARFKGKECWKMKTARKFSRKVLSPSIKERPEIMDFYEVTKKQFKRK